MLAAETNGAARRAGPAPRRTLIKGAGAMLARYMDESRSIPTATSFRTLTVTDARRPPQAAQGGRPARLLHPPDRLRDRPRRDRADAGDGARTSTRSTASRTSIDDGAGQPRHRGRRRAQGRRAHADGAGHPRRRPAPVPEFLAAFNDLIARARDNKLTADDLQGANVSLTNPGGIGTIASVPRLMKGQGTIVATGAIGYPPGLGAVGARSAPRR